MSDSCYILALVREFSLFWLLQREYRYIEYQYIVIMLNLSWRSQNFVIRVGTISEVMGSAVSQGNHNPVATKECLTMMASNCTKQSDYNYL